MKISWLILPCALVLMLCVQPTHAQLLTGVDSGPASVVPTDPAMLRELSESERAMNRPAPGGNTIDAPDEYGYFNFNGILSGLNGGYVAIPNPPNENVDGTVEAWIYPTDSTNSAPCIVGKGDSTFVGFLFGISWGANPNVLYLRFGNTATINTGGTPIPVNQWTHVAATWTGGAGNYTITFYVNGAQSGSPATNAGTWLVSTDSMTIGTIRAPFGGKNFQGNIDEVRYWNPARTVEQIRDNRFVGLGDGPPSANANNELTSSNAYAGLDASYNFNVGGVAEEHIHGYAGVFRGAVPVFSSFAPQPMAYNFALLCPFGANDYVTVPDNPAFNLSSGGTAEAWVYMLGSTTTHMILSRGTSGFNFFWGIRQSTGRRQAVDIGAGVQFNNADGDTIPLNRWTHVATRWVARTDSFTVTFFVNGKQSGTPITNATTWNSTSGTLRIGGWHGGPNNNFNGYLDEVRLWNVAQPSQQIPQNMFVSGRSLMPNANLVGLWNFDGNLFNRGTVSGISGSFDVGDSNRCRLSSYTNETNSGALTNSFIAHATVINHGGSPNPFPVGFQLNANRIAINDLQTIRDTLSIGFSEPLTAIEVFLAIQHTFAADLDITLIAPNGASRDLSSDNGGTGEGVLTFLIDGATALSTTGFFPPWSRNAAPEVAMGTFDGTNTQGNWILQVTDDANADQGFLLGWGLRLNNRTTAVGDQGGEVPLTYELSQNYPNPFNPTTTIRYALPVQGRATLKIYDMLGREVTTLVNDVMEPGTHSVQWNAANVATGVYFYRLEAGTFSATRKLVVLK